MDTAFPFGFPLPTAFYLFFYVFTLVIHVVFMNYVLAGTTWLAVGSIFARRRDEDRLTISKVLRDWMPFAVGATITAGVAPLLFIQILYRYSFYTANLLLFNRWMSILPVLIVGFYLLYLLKARRVSAWPAWLRVVITVGAFLCFAFTAYSWTENHLLMRRRELWADFYGSSSIFFYDAELLPRLALWFLGAFPTMALLVSWQLWYAQRRNPESVAAGEPRRAATLALVGMVLTTLAGILYYAAMTPNMRGVFTGSLAGGYFAAASMGLAVQFIAWIAQRRRPRFQMGLLTMASVGAVLTISGMTVVREGIRLVTIDIASLYAAHERAMKVGGFPVFVFFFVLNAVVIGWCVYLVRTGGRTRPA
ncbi:MAG: hypothetical protein J5J06_14335 [Phycisphaerae bacterium]|nr:hypothetical protein [Phycisphaerae bacterium]